MLFAWQAMGNDIKKLAKQGDLNAQHDLGISYYNGHGTKYYNGAGVSRDYDKSIYWLTKAANQGHKYSQLHLGLVFHEGAGVSQDYNKAIYWLTKAANQGMVNAQLILGIGYLGGEGFSKNREKAKKWLTKAANQNSEKAKEYLQKIKKEEDQLKIVNTVKKMTIDRIKKEKITNTNSIKNAEEDNPSYQLQKGVDYNYSGDYENAEYWLLKASNQDNAKAQFILSGLYIDKNKGLYDRDKALYWLRKAANNGSPEAKEWFSKYGKLANPTRLAVLDNTAETTGVILGFILVVAIIGLYFLPTIIARRRKHKNENSIVALNFFLGWTFIGWVISLSWAFSDNVKKDESKKIINVKAVKTIKDTHNSEVIPAIEVEEIEELQTTYLPNGTVSKNIKLDRRIS